MNRMEVYRLEYVDHSDHVEAFLYDGMGNELTRVEGTSDLEVRARAFASYGGTLVAEREKALQVNPEGEKMQVFMGSEGDEPASS